MCISCQALLGTDIYYEFYISVMDYEPAIVYTKQKK